MPFSMYSFLLESGMAAKHESMAYCMECQIHMLHCFCILESYVVFADVFVYIVPNINALLLFFLPYFNLNSLLFYVFYFIC